MSPALRARLAVLAAALLFSTGGAGVKATSLDAWQVASFRCGIAALVAFALMPSARVRPTRRIVLAAASYAATVILFVRATKLTTAANAIFLQSTAPIWLVFLAPTVLGERVRPRDLAFLVVLAGALVLFFLDAPDARASAPRPFAGDVTAVVSGLTWAATLVSLRLLERAEHGGAGPALLYGNLIGFSVCLPFALPVAAAASDVVVIAYLGAFQVALAYVCLTAGVRALPALEASLLLLLEPVLNPLWAYFIHGEQPGRLALFGGAIILGATLVQTLVDTRARRPREIAEGA